MDDHAKLEYEYALKQYRCWSAQGEYSWADQWYGYANAIQLQYNRYDRAKKAVAKKQRFGEKTFQPTEPNLDQLKRPKNLASNQLTNKKTKNPLYQNLHV